MTDDNFARNRNWEAILDRLILLKKTNVPTLRLIFQVDTLCHRIPRFIEKIAQSGCIAVFIGLENINPESLIGAKKRQNKIWEYREMFQAWQRAKVMTGAGYIIGFPNDPPSSIARDIELIKRELPVDLLEFFVITPLPGSEDHLTLHKSGARLDPDMNNYDLEHFCADHERMTMQERRSAYLDAWARYYSQEHVETIMRRAAANGRTDPTLYEFLIAFSGAVAVENIHPLQLGLFRRKVRTTRRLGMRIVHPVVFYPARAWEMLTNLIAWARLAFPRWRSWHRIMNDPERFHYTDAALNPSHAGNWDLPRFIRIFADKIPVTHGAPFQPPRPRGSGLMGDES